MKNPVNGKLGKRKTLSNSSHGCGKVKTIRKLKTPHVTHFKPVLVLKLLAFDFLLETSLRSEPDELWRCHSLFGKLKTI